MDKYLHLTLQERKFISDSLNAKISITEIAKQLNRHRSTIYREIRRNYSWMEGFNFHGYYHHAADGMAKDRRTASATITASEALRAFIIEKLRMYWSPEQIAGYLRKSGTHSICHETIYKFIYSPQGKQLHLYQYLYKARKTRRKRFGRKARSTFILLTHSIHQRPEYINLREEFGHWEGDLVIFRREYGKANVSTLIERKTRYTIILKNENRVSNNVIGQIRESLKILPKPARKTLTLDRGSEFASYKTLDHYLKIKSYFCDLHSPWQKGSIEHFNARLRKLLPLDTDISPLTPEEIDTVCSKLNNIPRKCLGYQTPKEAFRRELSQIPAVG